MERDDRCLGEARSQTITPGQANQWLVANGAEEIREPMRVASLTKRPGSSLFDLLRLTGLEVDPDSCRWAEIELRYEGYLAREATQAARLARFEELAIPPDMALANLQGLSHEAREKLGARRPATVGQASRIPGVSPADLHSLIFEVLRGQRAVPA